MKNRPTDHHANPPQGVFLDTSGNDVIGLGICDRCHFRFPIGELYPDGDIPGLMVCRGDRDTLDPYRLPPPPPDKWNLPFVRPDVPLINPYGDVPPFPVPASNPAFPLPNNTLNVGPGNPFITGPDGEEIEL
jgi:hypothetical protein